MRKILLFLWIPFFCQTALAQTELPLSTVLNLLVNGHPLYKNAGIFPKSAEAALMMARGGFDPTADASAQEKEFNNTQYYSYQNLGLQVPIWIGDLNAGYESAAGQYLNPESTIPTSGLSYVGLSVPLLKNVITDKRRTTLRQARVYREQNKALQIQTLNDLAYEVIKDYSEWYYAWVELIYFNNAMQATGTRLEGLKKSVKAGSIAAIDTLETSIQYKNFQISAQAANLKFRKAGLALSAHLWTPEMKPLEPSENAIPSYSGLNALDSLVRLNSDTQVIDRIQTHPILMELFAINDIQRLETKLKKQSVLPDVKLKYNALAPGFYNYNQRAAGSDYQFGVSFKSSLFLREQRGEYKLASLKLESYELKTAFKQRELSAKIRADYQQTEVYRKLKQDYTVIVNDYNNLYLSEISRFEAGESNLFLVNTRELRLIESRLKELDFNAKAIYSNLDYLKNSGLLYQILPALQIQ